MIKFINEKSEALYYKLLDKFGKEKMSLGKDHKTRRLRFPIDPELGVNKTLFVMAEYTEYAEFSNRNKNAREKNIEKIRNLDFEVSEVTDIVRGSTREKMMMEAIVRSKIISKSSNEITEDELKDLIKNFIKNRGYLFAKKVLEEELNKLNERIEIQQAELREATNILSEAEAKKEQCLKMLYGAE